MKLLNDVKALAATLTLADVRPEIRAMKWGMMVKVQNSKVNYYSRLYQAGPLDEQIGDHNAPPEEIRYLAELAVALGD